MRVFCCLYQWAFKPKSACFVKSKGEGKSPLAGVENYLII